MSLNIGQAAQMVQSNQIRDGLGVIDLQTKARETQISPTASPEAGGSFLSQLKDAIREVDTMQKDSDVDAVDLATGHNKNIHEAMISMEKADIAMKSMLAVRNKVLDAYREIMRMQV